MRGIDASLTTFAADGHHRVDVLARASVQVVNGNIRFWRFGRTLSAKAK